MTKLPTRRFRFQDAPPPVAATAPAGAASPLAPAIARLETACDIIAVSLEEIRTGLDRIAAMLDAFPQRNAKAPRARRAVEDDAQEMLPLLFS